VFNDFQAAAKYLIHQGYTTSDKLCIHGRSNGGLLAAACALQAPELFGCVVASMGLYDMLRFPKFTCGCYWTDEFGDPESPDAFDHLFKYSPVHKAASADAHPPILIHTSDHDDRVVPLHAYKHIPALQHRFKHSRKPLLLRTFRNAGHGVGIPRDQKLDEWMDVYGYIAKTLGLQYREEDPPKEMEQKETERRKKLRTSHL